MNIWKHITVKSIDNVFLVPSIEGHDTTIYNRTSYGLSFSYGGKIEYRYHGKSYVSDPTCAILLPQEQTYFLHRAQSGDFPVINFTCTDDFTFSDFFITPLRNPNLYLRDFERLNELSLSEKNPQKRMSIFYDILARLSEETEGEGNSLLSPAVDYLAKHFNDPTLSNEILAKQAKISEVYFRKLFKECYGITPHQYLLETRMRHAKLLLSEHAASVTAISEACGFSSVYHFCRAFKQFTGHTPKEFEERQLP